jgi:hypothetical protein
MILNNLLKKVDLMANLATIAIAILLGIAIFQHYSQAKVTSNAEPPKSAEAKTIEPVRAGEKLPVPGIEWAKNERTLLLALSQGCRYCSASAPFYKRLAKEISGQKNIGVVAVFPQSVTDARTYLNGLGIAFADVRQVPLDSLGVLGTPTLILVNKEGVVTNAWRGQLPSNKEDEVLSQLKCGTERQCS